MSEEERDHTLGLTPMGYFALDAAMKLTEKGVPVEVIEYALGVDKQALLKMLMISVAERENLANEAQEFLGEVD